MPSSTKKQAKFMAAVAHNKEFADKVDVPQSVGKEFNKADSSPVAKAKSTMKYKKLKDKLGMK